MQFGWIENRLRFAGGLAARRDFYFVRKLFIRVRSCLDTAFLYRVDLRVQFCASTADIKSEIDNFLGLVAHGLFLGRVVIMLWLTTREHLL